MWVVLPVWKTGAIITKYSINNYEVAEEINASNHLAQYYRTPTITIIIDIYYLVSIRQKVCSDLVLNYCFIKLSMGVTTHYN